MYVSFSGMSKGFLRYYELHSHENWEIILNIQGEGVSIVNGKEYPFKSGTIECIAPNIMHTKRSEAGFLDIYIETPVLPFVQTDTVVRLEDDFDKTIETLMTIIFRNYHLNKSAANCSNKASMDMTVSAILDGIFGLIQNRLEKNTLDFEVESFINVLLQNFFDPEFDLKKAIYKTMYCSDYFRRKFKKATNKTPLAYLNFLRIEYAKKLLLQSSKNIFIAEIAHMSGFYDPRYFSRLFKSIEGVTPTEFVKK